MKTKLLATLMLLSLLTSVSAIAMNTLPASAANENVILSINPATTSKLPADVTSFFDVYVHIAAVTDLYGFDIKVTWADNTLITIDAATSNASTTTILNGIWGVDNWFFVKYEASGGGGGGGYFRYVALSTKTPTPSGYTGSGDLIDLHFQIKRSCNFVLSTTIHIDTVKLSDSSWNAIVPHTITDGTFSISATTPDLEFDLVNPNSNKPYEYCKYIEVQVYATHICAQLTDYDLTINYNSELLAFVDVDAWGVFGTGTVSNTAGSVHVSGSGTAQTGEKILLFTLTFHIEFDQRDTHIWRTSNLGPLSAQISLDTTTGDLSFVEGYKYVINSGDITLPSPVSLTINLIQGDVDCNGKVDVLDLRTVASYYDLTPGPAKYDLKTDGTIDIFDLVVVAVNFGYYKLDTKP